MSLQTVSIIEKSLQTVTVIAKMSLQTVTIIGNVTARLDIA